MEDFFIQGFRTEPTYDLDGEIRLFVRYRAAAFVITCTGRQLMESPTLLGQHEKIWAALEEDYNPKGNYKAARQLRQPFEPLMAQLAPDLSADDTLHFYCYPPTIGLVASVESDNDGDHIRPEVTGPLWRHEIEWRGQNTYHIAHLLDSLATLVTTHTSRQVHIVSYKSYSEDVKFPAKVTVDGLDGTYYLKFWEVHHFHSPYELKAYRKILAADQQDPALLSDARICRLRGLVVDDEKDVLRHYPLRSEPHQHLGVPNDEVEHPHEPCTRLVGLLLDYIENKGTLNELVPWNDCLDSERDRWVKQISHNVSRLHRAGIAWGDAKPDNVLVDTEGNAWLIDFGGSYTPTWVDKDKKESIAGDEQGLERINAWVLECAEKPIDRYSGKGDRSKGQQ